MLVNGADDETNFSIDLRPHKIVLPAELLKDLQETEEGQRCLDDTSDDGFFYIPDFISEAEEAHVITKIQNAPQPKWRSLQARRLQNWGGQISKQVLIPETLPDFLISFPPIIQRLCATTAFRGSKHQQPNHCLMNEYEPGQGIMPHEDGAAYYPVVATVSVGGTTLLDVYRYANEEEQQVYRQQMVKENKEAPTARAREQKPRFSILQEPRSLLITRGSAYRLFLHGIAQRTSDDAAHLAAVTNGDMLGDEKLRKAVSQAKRGKLETSLQRQIRYSLTLRDVERVAPKTLASMLSRK